LNKISLNVFLVFLLPFFSSNDIIRSKDSSRINRYEIVHRHIPILTKADSLSPFTVGNGEFAFTTDVTGLQTFPDYYERGIPLGTQSQWGWHSIPDPDNYSLDSAYEYYDTYGRQVPYASKQHSKAGEWLRSNPHRLHLGRIGFKINKSDGSEIILQDIKDINQSLDLWRGIIKSSFTIEDHIINVETTCHPSLDQIASRINSELLNTNRVGIRFDFPYGSLSWGKESTGQTSLQNKDRHSSEIISQNDNSVIIKRTLDSEVYFVTIQWKGTAQFRQVEKHSFLLSVISGNNFEFTSYFSSKENKNELPGVEETFNSSEMHWKNFWETGGAIDLSESTDPRAFELERRIVLSRYLTAVQCAGSLPPQETGLTFNSWFGKFHLEMHWWHSVHFALWNKPELLEKSLSWYNRIFPLAKKTAERQGYKGVRWLKMVAYDGRESPSTIGVFLIWQQPHPIYYAELLYRYQKDQSIASKHSVLEKYKDIVFATADFMASYAQWDDKNKRYVLGPPVIPAQEIYKPDSTMNPSFELAYWSFGLKTAQLWRERLSLERDKEWDDIIKNLSKFPVNNNLYQNAETALQTFDDELHRNDHPTLLAAFGMLPNKADTLSSDSIDINIMRNTLHRVLESWNWETTWGWDYPLIAMTAARVGEPELAIDALLMDVQKNRYLNNGHNYQNESLPIYLPGNGGLLTAVAMMAAGWEGSLGTNAPGFPKNGKWIVKYENLNPLP
jgi:hypothetical protein